ncbi:uncharacterized protein [Palaemon carinicauda]|uniref:uncharacterized protein n=1 Tax=Palaemon carinicauda TaxID=392227 RepID=UPI0035B5A571
MDSFVKCNLREKYVCNCDITCNKRYPSKYYQFYQTEKSFCVTYPTKTYRNEVNEFAVERDGGDGNSDKILEKYLGHLAEAIQKKLKEAIPRKFVIPGFNTKSGSYDILVPKIILKDLSKVEVKKSLVVLDVTGKITGIEISGYFKDIEAGAEGTLTKESISSGLTLKAETTGPHLGIFLLLDPDTCDLSVNSSDVKNFQVKSVRVCRKGRLSDKIVPQLSAFYKASVLFTNKTTTIFETGKIFEGVEDLIWEVVDTNPVPNELRSVLECTSTTTTSSGFVPSNSPSSSAYPEDSFMSSMYTAPGRVLKGNVGPLPSAGVSMEPKAAVKKTTVN